jgi:hypothetical protein
MNISRKQDIQPVSLQNSYVLDKEEIKLNAYRLLCLFYANKEIARTCPPDDQVDGPAMLERLFFTREMTRLLLNVAIGIRVLDDQMHAAPLGESRERYFFTRSEVDRRHNCMMFDDMPLRQVCNKIIHASVVEPHFTKSADNHELDEYKWLAWSAESDSEGEGALPEPQPTDWEHLTGNVRLGGRDRGSQWWHLLQVPVFVGAVTDLLC